MATIVLVEDDDDLRCTMAEFLTGDGHEIRPARDGVEGLQALDERFPQLVITDLEMPRLDGCAMIFRMFVENLGRENVPVIIVSAGNDVRRVAAAVGTPYFLTKPFSVDALRSTIERALTEAIPPRPPGCLG